MAHVMLHGGSSDGRDVRVSIRYQEESNNPDARITLASRSTGSPLFRPRLDASREPIPKDRTESTGSHMFIAKKPEQTQWPLTVSETGRKRESHMVHYLERRLRIVKMDRRRALSPKKTNSASKRLRAQILFASGESCCPMEADS